MPQSSLPYVTSRVSVQLGSGQSYTVSNSSGGVVFLVDGSGNVSATGTLTLSSGSTFSSSGPAAVLLRIGTTPNTVIDVDAFGNTQYWSIGQGLATIVLKQGTYSTLFTGIIGKVNNIATTGVGVPAEYASTTTSAVALQTGSTSIKSYMPTANQQFLVVVSVVSTASTITGTITATYADVTSGSSTTQSATIAALNANQGTTVVFLCNAKSGTAIAVTGTASTNSDLNASASIFAL
jgi:hypothetical protein